MFDNFARRYRKVLLLAGIRTPPRVLFLSATVILFLSILLSLVFHTLWFFLIGFVIATFVVVHPYSQGEQILAEIDENLPDALKQIASTLRSGGTFEIAAREVSSGDYGALSKEFRRVLNYLQGGDTLDVALTKFADRIPSELVQRVTTIIIDAFRAGGGLAQVLEDVSEDARETQRLFKERRAKTTMQAMFMFAASGIIGPFIVGAAMGIMDFFVKLGKDFVRGGAVSPSAFVSSLNYFGTLTGLLEFYVLFQAFLSAIMMSTMREGNLGAGLRNAPWLMLLAYTILTLTRLGVSAMLGA